MRKEEGGGRRQVEALTTAHAVPLRTSSERETRGLGAADVEQAEWGIARVGADGGGDAGGEHTWTRGRRGQRLCVVGPWR